MKPQALHSPSRQRGVVLIVALIMLVIMSLLGLSGIRTIALEEKMSANAYDRSLAFQAAETALRVAEEDAGTRALGSKPAQTDGKCNTATLIATAADGYISRTDIDCDDNWPVEVTLANWKTYAKTIPVTRNLGTLITIAPSYLIEYLSDEAPCQPNDPTSTDLGCHRYRITARAIPGDGRADVMLQSIYFSR